jgi:hypothetical protein
MNFPSLKCMAAVAALAGLTSPASADIVSLTYTGTVSSVSSSSGATDGLNLFGGGDLTGDNFQVVFTFDTSKGTIVGSRMDRRCKQPDFKAASGRLFSYVIRYASCV